MASTNNFDELIADPAFQKLAAEILEVVAKAQANPETSANVACDALQYVNALIYEASPYNEGPKGLRDAHKQISADTKVMLDFIRAASLRRGEPLLFSMTKSPTVN